MILKLLSVVVIENHIHTKTTSSRQSQSEAFFENVRTTRRLVVNVVINIIVVLGQ